MKDVDFEQLEITVRDGKGQKDRVAVMPAKLAKTAFGPPRARAGAASARPEDRRRKRRATVWRCQEEPASPVGVSMAMDLPCHKDL